MRSKRQSLRSVGCRAALQRPTGRVPRRARRRAARAPPRQRSSARMRRSRARHRRRSDRARQTNAARPPFRRSSPGGMRPSGGARAADDGSSPATGLQPRPKERRSPERSSDAPSPTTIRTTSGRTSSACDFSASASLSKLTGQKPTSTTTPSPSATTTRKDNSSAPCSPIERKRRLPCAGSSLHHDARSHRPRPSAGGRRRDSWPTSSCSTSPEAPTNPSETCVCQPSSNRHRRRDPYPLRQHRFGAISSAAS
jgi:hypothetical protein